MQRNIVVELVLNETIEVFVPITFMLSYLIVYYGPNYGVIGNVGFDYWTFKKIEDVKGFLTPVALMALADCASGFISGVLLWEQCRINIILEYCSAIRKYWSVIGGVGAAILLSVNIFIRLNNI